MLFSSKVYTVGLKKSSTVKVISYSLYYLLMVSLSLKAKYSVQYWTERYFPKPLIILYCFALKKIKNSTTLHFLPCVLKKENLCFAILYKLLLISVQMFLNVKCRYLEKVFKSFLSFISENFLGNEDGAV